MPSIMMVSRRLLVLAAAAAWLVMSSVCNARSGVLLMPSEKLTFYATVPFNTANATEKSYRYFISHLREEMGVRDKVHGIPRLYSVKDLSEPNRYLQVALYNVAGNRITLALDRVTANVVAYRTDTAAYFFPDTIDITKNLFYLIPRINKFPFNSSYSSMESFAGYRSTVDLGMRDLDDSIQYLYDFKVAKLSPSLLVVSQMIADAIRYRYVEDVVVQHILDEPVLFKPPEEMIYFEDKWIQLSTSIQQSLGDIITPAFQPTKISEPITTIYPILGLNFGVMLYVCDNCTQEKVAPIHLIGRNGLCVDLQDGLSYDGNAVILLPCSDSSKTQLWTALLNGTIQSMGKCLTAYRHKAERYVMIHNCMNKPSHSGIEWELQNGNIVDKSFNLSLNAFTGDEWSVLTVEQSLYQSRQRWTFTNSTKPYVTTLKSYDGKCIEPSNNFSTVHIVNCGESVQSWKLYPDGTVRPSNEYMSNKCLTYNSSTDTGKTVILLPCNGGDAERWRLHHDYSISDQTNANVLEINEAQKNIMVVERNSDAPTNQQIFKIQSTNWS